MIMVAGVMRQARSAAIGVALLIAILGRWQAGPNILTLTIPAAGDREIHSGAYASGGT